MIFHSYVSLPEGILSVEEPARIFGVKTYMSPCNSSRLWLGMTMFASIFRNGSHSENCWLPAVSNWKLQVIPCKWLVERYFGPDPIVAQKAILFFDSSSFFCSQSNNKPATFWCFFLCTTHTFCDFWENYRRIMGDLGMVYDSMIANL